MSETVRLGASRTYAARRAMPVGPLLIGCVVATIVALVTVAG